MLKRFLTSAALMGLNSAVVKHSLVLGRCSFEVAAPEPSRSQGSLALKGLCTTCSAGGKSFSSALFGNLL